MRAREFWQGAVLCASLWPGAAMADGSASPRQAIYHAWWTGPLLAAGATTLPKGRALIEPYFYDFHTVGRFDDRGKRRSAAHDDSFGSLSYLLYGVSDTFTAGLIPHFGYRSLRDGSTSSSPQVGDLTVQGQFLINRYRPGHGLPALAVVVQESLPVGRHDGLDRRPNDGFGTGAYATTIGLNSQTYFWMPGGRILRTRLNMSYAVSTSAHVHDRSVYGTPTGFRGRARPGDVLTVDLGLEYSLSRRWVLALDLGYERDGSTRVTGVMEATGARWRIGSGPSEAMIVAPAIEYNLNANIGVIVGTRIVAAGRNTSATVAPVMAINYVL